MKNNCKDEIRCAELQLLIYSWIGALSAVAVVVYALCGL